MSRVIRWFRNGLSAFVKRCPLGLFYAILVCVSWALVIAACITIWWCMRMIW